LKIETLNGHEADTGFFIKQKLNFKRLAELIQEKFPAVFEWQISVSSLECEIITLFDYDEHFN